MLKYACHASNNNFTDEMKKAIPLNKSFGYPKLSILLFEGILNDKKNTKNTLLY